MPQTAREQPCAVPALVVEQLARTPCDSKGLKSLPRKAVAASTAAPCSACGAVATRSAGGKDPVTARLLPAMSKGQCLRGLGGNLAGVELGLFRRRTSHVARP